MLIIAVNKAQSIIVLAKEFIQFINSLYRITTIKQNDMLQKSLIKYF